MAFVIVSDVVLPPHRAIDLSHANRMLERFTDQRILTSERARFDESPLTSSRSRAASTCSPPDRGPVVDKWAESVARGRILYPSSPGGQFVQQVELEIRRIWHRRGPNRWGRRIPLGYDDRNGLYEQARDTIQEQWLKRGIWAEEWKPDRGRVERFSFSNIWAHERSPPPSRAMSPEVPANIEGDNCDQTLIFGQCNKSSRKAAPKTDADWRKANGELFDPQGYQNLTVRDRQASKPMNQFEFQVGKEIEWLKDENDWQESDTHVDITPKAREEVKARWIKDGIWNPEWGNSELPGEAWRHEEDSVAEIRELKLWQETWATDNRSSSNATRTSHNPLQQTVSENSANTHKRKRKEDDGVDKQGTTKKSKVSVLDTIEREEESSTKLHANSKTMPRGRSNKILQADQDWPTTERPAPRRSNRIAARKALQESPIALQSTAKSRNEKINGKNNLRKGPASAKSSAIKPTRTRKATSKKTRR